MKRLIALFILLISFSAQAELPVYLQGLYQKTENKQKSRFTISDWISQKQNSRLMDQWLAMNRAPELFEFFVRGGTQSYDVAGETESGTWINGGLFLTIFGFEYEADIKHDETEIQSSTFHIRILGEAYQSTHLTLHGGLQNTTDLTTNTQFQNPYYGAELGLYIFSFFGFEGRFRQVNEDTDALGNKLWGIQYQYGPFIELGFLRLNYSFFRDEMKFKDSTTETDQVRGGVRLGASLYF